MLLNEVLNPNEQGFFEIIKEQYSPCFLNNPETDVKLLDVNLWAYYGNKTIAPVYEQIISITDTIKEANKMLAKILFTTYGNSWNRMYKALTAEYNPINNYEMKESGKDVEKNQYSDKDIKTGNNTSTQTPDIITTDAGTNNSEGGLYGANSDTSVPSDTASSENSNTHTEKGTVTTADTISDVSEKAGNTERTTTHEFTRSGNIGVTTSTQMIEQEIAIRKRTHFFEMMTDDIINYITLRIY